MPQPPGPFEIVVRHAAGIEFAGHASPRGDGQAAHCSAAGGDHGIVRGPDLVVGVLVRRLPTHPGACGTLHDVAAQRAVGGVLHLGQEFGAPPGLVPGGAKFGGIAIVRREQLGLRGRRRGQGVACSAVAELPHRLIVVSGAMPSAGHVHVRAVGQFRVIEMARSVPAWHVASAALHEEKFDGGSRCLLWDGATIDDKGKRFATNVVIAGNDPIRAGMIQLRKIDGQKYQPQSS